MRKFRFKFAAVEKVRKTRENDALRALGEAQQAFHKAQAHKSRILKEREQSLIRREALGQEPARILEFQLENEFIAGTKVRATQADQAILRATRGVEKALRTYLHARRQMRMIELLREKEFEEFKKAMAKQEQRRMDDLNVMRAGMSSLSARLDEEEQGAAV